MSQGSDPRSFEAALGELEARVAKLERGDLALEEALRLFEEGVGLVRECHERLDAADARIIALTAGAEGVREAPFGDHGEDTRS
ncbi:MAG: exodeoxyribonuclease VII small subunit [Pseudomonadota bacterium]|nr:exodeoxyribonuclease VII small subunit [Pseudomonadota bacterium]